MSEILAISAQEPDLRVPEPIRKVDKMVPLCNFSIRGQDRQTLEANYCNSHCKPQSEPEPQNDPASETRVERNIGHIERHQHLPVNYTHIHT